MGGIALSSSGQKPPVLPGVNVFFEEHHYESLKGKRIGLITNQTGVDWKLRPTLQMFCEHASELEIVALFSPEHGLQGQNYAEISVNNEKSGKVAGLQSLWRHPPADRGNA